MPKVKAKTRSEAKKILKEEYGSKLVMINTVREVGPGVWKAKYRPTNKWRMWKNGR